MLAEDRIALGRVFRLKTATPGTILDAKRRPIRATIPRGALLSVSAANQHDVTVEVLWDGVTVIMFVLDLREHGELTAA